MRLLANDSAHYFVLQRGGAWAFPIAHKAVAEIVGAIEELAALGGKAKRQPAAGGMDEVLDAVRARARDEMRELNFTPGKLAREAALRELLEIPDKVFLAATIPLSLIMLWWARRCSRKERDAELYAQAVSLSDDLRRGL